MAGTKRAAEDSGPTTRSSKAPKKDSSSAPSKGKRGAAKKASKPGMPLATFRSKAMPLHLNITHTPPPTAEAESETKPPQEDPGFIGTLALVVTPFKTGSYGWKGSKRVKIELKGDGESETVDVQFTINATVMNSKGADNGEEKEEKGDEEEEEADAEKD